MVESVCIRSCTLHFRVPPTCLQPEARYDELMAAFGGKGFLVRTVEELRSALQLSLSDWERPSLLNILIDPSSDRKQQVATAARMQSYQRLPPPSKVTGRKY